MVDEIIQSVHKLSPKDGEYIVLYYDIHGISKDILPAIHNMVSNAFPNIEVLALPRASALVECDIDDLRGYYGYLKQIIDSKEMETYIKGKPINLH